MLQMEMSSGIAECLCTLYALIVQFLFYFFSIYRFLWEQVLLELGKCKVAVNVVECDFDLLGRDFILQN